MTKVALTALLAGFATLAQAIKLTNSDYDVVPGQLFTIEWTDAEGPVSIRLKSGPANSLVTVEEIAGGQTGGSYTWSVPSNLETSQYAIEIEDGDGNVNYSIQFPVSGDGGTQTTAPVTESSPTTVAESTPTTAAASISTEVSVPAITPESTFTTVAESDPTTTPEAVQTTQAEESSVLSTTEADPAETSSAPSESDVPDSLNDASGRSASIVAGLIAGAALLAAY